MADMTMGLREYARHRSVSLKAVQKAIREGRIDTVEVDGAVRLDPVTADTQWAERTRPKESSSSANNSKYHQSKAEKEYYAAKISKLDYEKRVGELLEVSDVKHELEKILSTCRNHLLNLPDQLAPELAGAASIHEISSILYIRINGCLKTLSDELLKVATDD